MSFRTVAIVLAAALVAGCAGSSKVMLGQARAPIDPAQVQIYRTPPAGSQEIAQLESKSAVGFGTQGQTDAAIARLKREAAAIGPRIHPFDATLRRPAQSLAGQPSEQLLAPSGAANPSV